MTKNYHIYYDEEVFGSFLGNGAAHSISYDSEKPSPEDMVRLIAEEISGESFSKPKRKIGFY